MTLTAQRQSGSFAGWRVGKNALKYFWNNIWISIMKIHFAFKKIRLATSWRTRFYQNNHKWLGLHNTTSHKPIVYKRCLFNILTNIMDFVTLDDLQHHSLLIYKINGANQKMDLLCLFSPNSFKDKKSSLYSLASAVAYF